MACFRRRMKERLIGQRQLRRHVFSAKGSFSDHFIRTRLPRVPTWPEVDFQFSQTYSYLKDLWQRRHIGLQRGNEETTRREFIDKILYKAGFAYLANLDLPEAVARRTP